MTAVMVDLLRSREVADMFRVDRKTVTRWADLGKLAAVRTPGGHRRYVRFQAEALLAGRDLTCEELTALQLLTGRQP